MIATTCTDRTTEFKQLVHSKSKDLSIPRRQQPNSSPAPSSSTRDAWTVQAQQVATNLRSFNNFLSTIRRAYLDLGGQSSSNQPANRGHLVQQGGQGGGGLLEQWQGVKYLTDKERDEIDFSVKIALRKSVERVRQLEQLEQVRISNEKRSKSTVSKPSTFSKLFKPLPSSSSSSELSTTSEQLSQHRQLITLYLNQLLQSVSERQRVQQETRVQRQLEKTSSLGGFGGAAAVGGGMMREFGEKMAEKAEKDYKLGKRLSRGGGEIPSLYQPNPSSSSNGYDFDNSGEDAYERREDEEEDLDGLDQLGRELTQEQIQQFEAEESLLLQSTRSDLESLRTAESSLLEISSLQTQLAVHLSQQSELTDNLWNEAIEVSGRVMDGNLQLKKAKERGKDSRMWLLVFLFGSSFTLLFLDYYSS